MVCPILTQTGKQRQGLAGAVLARKPPCWVSEDPPTLQPCYTDQNLTDLVWTLVQDSDPVHLPELVTDVDQT